jgi:hypothetical protein
MSKKSPFLKLENAKIPRLEDGVSLNTLLLEKEMMQYNGGIDLSSKTEKNMLSEEDEFLCKKFVPYFSEHDEIYLESRIINNIPIIPAAKPCSMLIDSIDELSRHMSNIYQISHFNYLLASKYIKNFPEGACGLSSRIAMLSALNHGYSNATYAYSIYADHGYVIYPFVLNNNSDASKIYGSIIQDPTSDQLRSINDPLLQTRNNVFIKLGTKWNYRTGWKQGKNMYPTRISIILSIDNCQKKYNEWKHSSNLDSYFKQVFSNPIPITLE